MATEKLLTITQAAIRFGVSPGTLRKLADNGHVKCIRLPSGYRRFRLSEIEGDLNRMRPGSRPETMGGSIDRPEYIPS